MSSGEKDGGVVSIDTRERNPTEEEIVLLRSSAGECNFRQRPGTPCVECLRRRLSEAGLDPASNLEKPSRLPTPAVIRFLDRFAEGDRRPYLPIVFIADGKTSRHILLPVPGCTECGRRQRTPRPGQRKLSVEVLMDPLVGITLPAKFTDPRIAGKNGRHGLCYSAEGWVAVPAEEKPLTAGGQGITARDALSRQLGEAVERYSALRPCREELVHATAEELDGPVPPVPLLNRYRKRQLAGTRFCRLRPNTFLAWVRGKSLKFNTDKYVPACYVYLTRCWNPDEPALDRMTSSGLAAHTSAREARRAALLELIERFTLTVAWHRQMFGRRLPETVLPGETAELQDRIKRARLRLLLLALAFPPDVPVVLGALIGDYFPRITLGSAADECIRRAAQRAAVEAAAQWQQLALLPESKQKKSPALDTHADALDHVLYYSCSPARSRRLANVLSQAESVPIPRLRAVPGSRVLEQACRLAADVIEIDITPPDCAWCGFSVKRIVAPGLPIFGFGSLSAPGADLNRFGLRDCRLPHPFG